MSRRLVTGRPERGRAPSRRRVVARVFKHPRGSRVRLELAVRDRDRVETRSRRALKRRAPREAGNRTAHTGRRERRAGSARERRRGRDGARRGETRPVFLYYLLLCLYVSWVRSRPSVVGRDDSEDERTRSTSRSLERLRVRQTDGRVEQVTNTLVLLQNYSSARERAR